MLQKLGLEIRKIGSIEDMYREVDLVISKLPNNFLSQTIAHGLQEMFQPSKHLSVCFIKQAAEATGIIIPRDHIQTYEMLHCISWSAMEANYRAQVMALILDDFRPILKPETKGSA